MIDSQDQFVSGDLKIELSASGDIKRVVAGRVYTASADDSLKVLLENPVPKGLLGAGSLPRF